MGVTLLELLVVLTVLGLIFGVTGLALRTLRAPRESAAIRALHAARTEAIRTGMPVRVTLDSSPLPSAHPPIRPSGYPPIRPSALFLPDGRAIGPGVDPLTGEPEAPDAAR